jgi:hypothetical protein
MEEKETMQGSNDNIWKIALALVCVGILGYGFFYSKNTTDDLAYLIGFNFPFTLIIWGIFYVAIARKRGAKIGGFSFLSIFICMIASGFIGYSQQKQEAKRALSEIQDQYCEFIESATDSQGLPNRIDKTIDTTPQARGEFGEIERFVKEFMNQMTSQRNDYLLELEAIGWNSILDPQRIRVDKGLIESRVTVRKATNIVAKYQERTNVLLHNTREKIGTLNISAPSKRESLSGFDRGMEKAKLQIDSMWALEGKVVAEFENIINLLSERNGAWVAQGSQILFYNDSDLNKFNSYIASIQSLVNQQQQIQNQSVETVNRNFNRIKEDLKTAEVEWLAGRNKQRQNKDLEQLYRELEKGSKRLEKDLNKKVHPVESDIEIKPDVKKMAEELSQALEGISKEDIVREFIEKLESTQIKYTSEKDAFAVLFPSLPQKTTINQDLILDTTVINYQSAPEDGYVQYNVFCEYHNDKKILSDESQEAYFTGKLATRLKLADDTSVIKDKKSIFRGFNSNEFKYTSNYEGVQITHEGITFFVDGDSIALTCIYPSLVSPSPTFEEFVESFELLPLEPVLQDKYSYDESKRVKIKFPANTPFLSSSRETKTILDFTSKSGYSIQIFDVLSLIPHFKMSDIPREYPSAKQDMDGDLINTYYDNKNKMSFAQLIRFIKLQDRIYLLQGSSPELTFFRYKKIFKSSMDTFGEAITP